MSTRGATPEHSQSLPASTFPLTCRDLLPSSVGCLPPPQSRLHMLANVAGDASPQTRNFLCAGFSPTARSP